MGGEESKNTAVHFCPEVVRPLALPLLVGGVVISLLQGFNRPRGLRRASAINRLLHRLEPAQYELWQEATAYVELEQGILVIDDTMLDKWYAKHMELVSRQWSGKHKRVVQGINLTSLLWSDGDKHIPCDYRLYEKVVDGATKNDHFRAMLTTHGEGERLPAQVCCDRLLV